MARIVNITCPQARTEALLENLGSTEGLLSVELYRGASLTPPGDVIKVALPNSALSRLMKQLDQYALGQAGGVSVTTSEPAGVIPTSSAYPICRDNNEAAWEEMELTISNDSNTTFNTLCAMAIAGGLAAAGIATNALHVVIGGMLIAPGFMPITRIALGLVTRQAVWRYGLWDLLRGYAALMFGALLMTLVLGAFHYDVVPGDASYYQPAQKLAHYWTSITAVGVLTSLISGIAGGLLIATRRSVLTSGVMIGLALVPAAALIPIGLAQGEFALAGRAALRFAIEIALVLFTSGLVLACIKRFVHQRDMRL